MPMERNKFFFTRIEFEAYFVKYKYFAKLFKHCHRMEHAIGCSTHNNSCLLLFNSYSSSLFFQTHEFIIVLNTSAKLAFKNLITIEIMLAYKIFRLKRIDIVRRKPRTKWQRKCRWQFREKQIHSIHTALAVIGKEENSP